MNTVDKMKIMQAWVDGEKIECKSKGDWCEIIKEPKWSWHFTKYRVMEEKIKGCPFCGHRVEMFKYEKHYSISCEYELCAIFKCSVGGYDRKGLIKKWNNRSSD